MRDLHINSVGNEEKVRFETLAVHAAAEPDPRTGAVTAAIQMSTTFERAADGTFPSGFAYIRDANPNRRALEAAVAALEGGALAVAFASGMAAAMAVFQTLAPGDHAVVPLDAYFGTSKLLREHFVPWGLEVTFADLTDVAAVRAALRPKTRLIWTETPSNPTIAVTDLGAIAAIAKAAGALLACDNTWATPFLQKPFTLGADLVMHSTTKYLSGHSDVMGGVVVAREAGPVAERLRSMQVNGGAVPSPFDSWLVLRGIRTLPWRMRALQQRWCRGGIPVRASSSRARALPRASQGSRLRSRVETDVGRRWDAVVRRAWRPGSSVRGRGAPAALHACHEPGWPREPRGAPRLCGGSRLTGAGRPASALHRPRAPGRSHRGSSTGARRLNHERGPHFSRRTRKRARR